MGGSPSCFGARGESFRAALVPCGAWRSVRTARELGKLIRENGGGDKIDLALTQGVESLLQGADPAATVAWAVESGDSVMYEIFCLTDHVLIRLKTTVIKDVFARADHLSEEGLEAWAVPVRAVEGVDLLSTSSAPGDGWRAMYRLRVANHPGILLPAPDVYGPARGAAERFVGALVRRL